jgi:hypothetical protein
MGVGRERSSAGSRAEHSSGPARPLRGHARSDVPRYARVAFFQAEQTAGRQIELAPGGVTFGPREPAPSVPCCLTRPPLAAHAAAAAADGAHFDPPLYEVTTPLGPKRPSQDRNSIQRSLAPADQADVTPYQASPPSTPPRIAPGAGTPKQSTQTNVAPTIDTQKPSVSSER